MTKDRNLQHRIRSRAARIGESSPSARRSLAPANGPGLTFETGRPSDYLLRAADSAAGKKYKSLAIERLGIEEGDAVLDLGCGTGGDLGPLLKSIGPAGSVTGVDVDATALDLARERYGDPRLRLLVGDAHALELDSASIDRVYVDRTMQHLAAPATALDQVRRVLRPGGRVVLAEPDWRTFLIDHPDPDLADAYRQFVVGQVIRNARIGSELPRLVQNAGLGLESVTPVTAVYTDAFEADRVFGFARVTRRAVAARHLPLDAAVRWLEHLGSQVFFASLTVFVTVARSEPSQTPGIVARPPERIA
ncbi:class I SAM-dependent methyltransferase [Humibacter antri]